MPDRVSARIIVADDHPMCRVAAHLAAKSVGVHDVVDAASLSELFERHHGANLIVLDLGLPDSRGVASLIDVIRECPDTPVLVVSGNESPDIERQVDAEGAAGFVSKLASLTALADAIQQVLAGNRYFTVGGDETVEAAATNNLARLRSLTPAEARVLRTMGDGRMNKQIAYDLGLSEITVKQHITAILRKLGARNRTQAILIRQQIGEV